VRDSIPTAASFVSSSSRPKPYAGFKPEFHKPCCARPRDATQLAVFSLQTCISAVVRESEYLSTHARGTQQHLSPQAFFPASSSETTAAHLNPRPRPPHRHCTPHFTLDDAAFWFADHTTLHPSIILIQPVLPPCDPHPGTLSTLIRFSQLRGNASCLSQPPILDSPTPALGHLQHLCLSHHSTTYGLDDGHYCNRSDTLSASFAKGVSPAFLLWTTPNPTPPPIAIARWPKPLTTSSTLR
jgi:hypothetical protein